MVNQYSLGPIMLFLLVVIAGAVFTGGLLGNSEVLNPILTKQEASVRETAAALSVGATEVVQKATETQLAQEWQQAATETRAAASVTEARRAAIAEQTKVPVQQTAARATQTASIAQAQTHATETALAGEAHNKELQVWATQTVAAGEVQNKRLQAEATRTELAARQTAANVAATREARNKELQTQATQTIVAGEVLNKQIQAEATRTELAARQTAANVAATREAVTMRTEIERANRSNTEEMLILLTAVVVAGMITGSTAYFLIMTAQAKQSEAKAKEMREQRLTLEVKNAIQTTWRERSGKIIPFDSSRQTLASKGDKSGNDEPEAA